MYCFTKARRLLKKEDYDRVFQQAKKIASSDFTFLYRENQIGYARVGLALSKKVIAKAHDRNRIKRIIREAFRLKTDLPAVDIIVLAKPAIKHVSHSMLIANLERTWNKISLLKNHE